MRGRGVCVHGGWGGAWQRAVCGRGCAGQAATKAGGTRHQTGMHSRTSVIFMAKYCFRKHMIF